MPGSDGYLTGILQHLIKASVQHDGAVPPLDSIASDKLARLVRVFMTGYRVGTHRGVAIMLDALAARGTAEGERLALLADANVQRVDPGANTGSAQFPRERTCPRDRKYLRAVAAEITGGGDMRAFDPSRVSWIPLGDPLDDRATTIGIGGFEAAMGAMLAGHRRLEATEEFEDEFPSDVTTSPVDSYSATLLNHQLRVAVAHLASWIKDDRPIVVNCNMGMERSTLTVASLMAFRDALAADAGPGPADVDWLSQGALWSIIEDRIRPHRAVVLNRSAWLGDF